MSDHKTDIILISKGDINTTYLPSAVSKIQFSLALQL